MKVRKHFTVSKAILVVFTCMTILVFQNCGNIKLLGGEEESPSITPTPSEGGPKSQGSLPEGCPYVDANGNDMVPPGHDGLTTASRLSETWWSPYTYWTTGGPNKIIWKDVLEYTSLFRVYSSGGEAGGRPLGPTGEPAEGYGWPGTWMNNQYLHIPPGKFVSLKLRVPSDISWKGVGVAIRNYSPESHSTGVSWSIAPCPGQFRNVSASAEGPSIELPSACVDTSGLTEGSGIYAIVSDPNDPYPLTGFGSKCPIEMGKSYYLNIMSVDASQPGYLDPARAMEHTWCPGEDGPLGPNPGNWCLTKFGRTNHVLDPQYR